MDMKKIVKNKTLVISLLAGTTALIYELICQRYLSLILGGEAYTVAVVVGCYMIGLSIGSIIFGTLADKNLSFAIKLSLFGFAAFCCFTPALYKFIDNFAPSGSIGIRVVICFLFMLPATICAGGVLPCLVKTGHHIKSPAVIYAIYTLGSITGALAYGFLFIRFLGLSATAYIAAGLTLICVGLAFFIHDQSEQRSISKVQKDNRAALKKHTGKIINLVIAAYCVSGFASMAFQVFQTKILTLFFRDSVYDFTIILTVYLVGLFIGNSFGGWIASNDENLLFKFIITQILAGVSVIAGLYIVHIMPFVTYSITSQTIMVERFGNNAFFMSNILKTGYSAIVVLFPAAFWGMGFPLVNKITAAGKNSAGFINGITIGVNTLLCSAGSLLSAFWLINILSIRELIILSGIICVLSGAILSGVGFKKHMKELGKKNLIIPGTLIITVLLLLFLPDWDRFEMSTSFLVPGQETAGSYEILFYREDTYGITSVVDFAPTKQKFLTTNRRFCQNSSDLYGPEDHRRLGILPLLIHPDPKEVLVVGLGVGITLSGANEFPGVAIDCAEISGAVVDAARCFAAENNNVLDAENVSIVIDDGRNYIKNTAKSYDVIIADIFFPMSSGSSSLFSQEYYQLCKNKLNPNGIMAQWIPAHQFSLVELKILIKTFSSVFENCQLWYGLIGESIPVIGILGSEKEIQIDGLRISELYNNQKLSGVLSEIAMDDEYMMLSHYITNVKNLGLEHEDLPINTDDKPILEYLNPENHDPFYWRAEENMGYVSYYKSTDTSSDYCFNLNKDILEGYNLAIFDYVYSIYEDKDSENDS